MPLKAVSREFPCAICKEIEQPYCILKPFVFYFREHVTSSPIWAILIFSWINFPYLKDIFKGLGTWPPATKHKWESKAYSKIKNPKKDSIILHCQSCHSEKFDFVDTNIVHCLPNVKYKIMRFFPNKQSVLLKHKKLPPLGTLEVLAFGTSRSSHSSVLISWSLRSWLSVVKLSLSPVYLEKQ